MKPPEFRQPELSNNESEAIHNIKHVRQESMLIMRKTKIKYP